MFSAQDSPEGLFLKKLFAEYYKKNFIDSVPKVAQREFGFGVFRKKITNRNMSFSSADEMNSFLRNNTPLFFSYSNSCYKFPSRTPMVSKEWLGADIIYEFDADELGLDVPEINGVQWFAREHIDEAKRQVFRLVDFLDGDFNFPASELKINFSGKAGFHVHLRSESVFSLKRQARIELVDYITAHSIDFEKMGFDFDAHLCPKQNGQWQKRLIVGTKSFFGKGPKEIAKLTAFPAKKFSFLLEKKDKLFDSLDRGVLMKIDSRKSPEFWKKILEEVVKVERVPIDRQTSVDLHKIVRVPQTLHGDTGMVAKEVLLDSLKGFDAFSDAVVFSEGFQSGAVKVLVLSTPKFSLFGSSFGPFENSVEELPLFCAVYLIGKGAAVLKQ